MILQKIKRLLNRHTKVKKCELSEEQIGEIAKVKINAKIDKMLKFANDNGLINIQRDHLKQLIELPGISDESNKKRLLIFLRDIDLQIKMAWEEQISAYIRIPMRPVFENPRVPYPSWR